MNVITGISRGKNIDDNPDVGARNLFFLSGQSNAVGACSVTTELESQYKVRYDKINSVNTLTLHGLLKLDYSNTQSYQEVTLQADDYGVQFYLWSQIQAYLNRSIYVSQYYLGATNLATNWKSTATVGALYTGLIKQSNTIKNDIVDCDGVSPSAKFFVWIQGETDADVLVDANNYQTNLTNFINNFRTDTGFTNLPFLICRLNISSPRTYAATVRAAQIATVGAVANTYIVNMDDCTLQGDNVHYTKEGYLTLANNILSVAQTNALI